MKIISFSNSYRSSKTGSPVFVHTFSASKEELEAAVNEGAIVRENDKGQPICFLNDQHAAGTELAVSKQGRLYAKTVMLNKSVQQKADTIKAFMAAGLSLDAVAALAFNVSAPVSEPVPVGKG